MKICIPVEENKGLASTTFNHFGSAPYFLIYDSEKGEVKAIDNKNLHHAHGQCQPLGALGGENVDAVLVGGIGAGAFSKLNNLGIKVYKVDAETVEENIEKFNNGQLPEFSLANSCNHHHYGSHSGSNHHHHHHG